MSNLSELLPTGGGQNAVDFVATGNLANGQAVALKTDGTVEVIAASTDSAGTPVIFATVSTGYTSSTFDSTLNKVVVAYSDITNGYYGNVVVGTVSGTSISFGTAVVFNSARSDRIATTFDSTNGKVVIAYRDWGNNLYGAAKVGTVSGTSISYGSAVVFEAAEIGNVVATFDSYSNKVVIVCTDNPNSFYGTAVVGTVSGTAISFGTAVVFDGTIAAQQLSATFDSTNNKIVISYQRSNGSTNVGTAVVGTVSGTAISFGTPVVFSNAVTTVTSATYDSANNKIVIAYQNGSNSYYGTAIVGTVSGTAISFGTAVVFESANTSFISATFDSSANKITIAYSDGGNSQYGTAIVGTVSGTSLSFGAAVVFESANSQNISITYDSANNKVVIVYQDNPNSFYGTSVVFTVGSSNNTSFIGITSEAISNGATGAINTFGGINTVQTGLTIASDYYVQGNGTLSTASASPAIKVGQALSATTINMKDLT